MNKRSKIMIFGSVTIILIIAVFMGLRIKEILTPSNEVMQLTDYYKVDEKEVMLILHDEIYEKKGKMIDEHVYLDYETVINIFNHRFYWDKNEEKIVYTSPTEIVRADVDSYEYSIDSNEKISYDAEAPLARSISDDLYISLDFVEEYSDIRAEFYEDPNRVIISYIWGDYLYTEVTRDSQLRLEADIKSPILDDLFEGDKLLFVDLHEPPKRGFSKVMTKEGIIGYVKDNFVGESDYIEIKSSYQKPEYTDQTRDHKINLVFHQVFTSNEAGNLEDLISQTQGVNVVSPTWFSIVDNEGTFTSLASNEYVSKAKELGLEVWALIDDFSPDVDMQELLSLTSVRERLINALMDKVDKYDLDGINIDFERVMPETGEHYVQFLRELSVKCRSEEIVLSVDNFVPPFKAHYDRVEQGEILDYIIIMAYDEHYSGSEQAGPNSSIGFVEDATRNIVNEIPKEKAIIAIPFYTRLWKETEEGDVSRERDFAMTPAITWIEENGGEAKWDDGYGSYYVEVEKDGAIYKMWQEEVDSIEEKMKVIKEADVGGVAAWKLGLERPEVWEVINKYLKK